MKTKGRKIRIENTFHNTEAIVIVPKEWIEDYKDGNAGDPWKQLEWEANDPSGEKRFRLKHRRAMRKMCGVIGCQCARLIRYAGTVSEDR